MQFIYEFSNLGGHGQLRRYGEFGGVRWWCYTTKRQYDGKFWGLVWNIHNPGDPYYQGAFAMVHRFAQRGDAKAWAANEAQAAAGKFSVVPPPKPVEPTHWDGNTRPVTGWKNQQGWKPDPSAAESLPF